MIQPSSVTAFLKSFNGRWLAIMSGAFSVPFAALSAYNDSYVKIIFQALAFLSLFIAAYQLWKEERSERIALEERLTPKIKVYLKDEGIYRFPSADDSVSQWAQIIVTPLTDTALVDCEVNITSIFQLGDNGRKHSLLEEHVLATWSDQPPGTIKLSIPPGVSKRANIASRNEIDRNHLTLHIWFIGSGNDATASYEIAKGMKKLRDQKSKNRGGIEHNVTDTKAFNEIIKELEVTKALVDRLTSCCINSSKPKDNFHFKDAFIIAEPSPI
jgi:hypothetical protein